MNALLIIILSVFFNTGNSFKSELENYLNKNLSAYKSYEYKVVKMPDSFKKIELLKPNEFNLSGNMVYVPVKVVKTTGRIIKSIITVKVKIYRDVYVSSKQLTRNGDLKQSDFTLKKEDITTVKGTPVYSLDKIGAYRSKTIVPAGEVLIEEDIEPIPVVNVGDKLNASFISGNVMVTFPVYARQDGVPGEVITVITKDRKMFRGKVLDSKNLTIQE